jgi:prepilin-type N-terminal cleavage/methylation domain-containing protein
MNIKNRKQQGFTIIEVLIVLAIAGLIMLIVFLAVPALQRNQRNTARKSDASQLLSELANVTSNANGTAPTACTGATASCWVRQLKLGQYDQTTAGVDWKGTATAANTGTAPTENQVFIYKGAECNGAAAVVDATNSRKTAAYLGIETSGSATTACIES